MIPYVGIVAIVLLLFFGPFFFGIKLSVYLIDKERDRLKGAYYTAYIITLIALFMSLLVCIYGSMN